MNRHARADHRRYGTSPAPWFAVVLAVLQGACAADRAETVPTRISAHLDRAAGEIRATVSGLRPSERVETFRLLGPDGTRLAPLRRTRQESVAATQSNPTVGVQARGGSASGIDPGLSLSFDLFDWSWGRSETRTQRGVSAVFAVPKSYRDRPDAWRVEAVVTDPTGPARTHRAAVAAR